MTSHSMSTVFLKNVKTNAAESLLYKPAKKSSNLLVIIFQILIKYLHDCNCFFQGFVKNESDNIKVLNDHKNRKRRTFDSRYTGK